VFGHPRAVAEEFQVAVIAVLSLEDEELVAELEEGLSVVVADLVGLLDPLSQRLDLGPWVGHGTLCFLKMFKRWRVNLR
jgi:hypothetical protein